jgi:lipoic acid synthetase
MKLKHCVLTSVDRDDLPDGGAAHWAESIDAIRRKCPGTTMETLIPDFDGREDLLDMIIDAAPEVVSHNLETVRRLTPMVRSRAKYDTSLAVIRYLASKGVITKSGIMLGLGEEPSEVLETMDDLIEAGCRIFTIGQYLQPSPKHLPVQAFITPEAFEEYRIAGLQRGFRHVESGPLVRSSYHAEKQIP